MRSGDAEAAPDADGLRPCGLALLRALLNRGGEPVAQALVQLAARLQARGAEVSDAACVGIWHRLWLRS